ncbi:MAG: DUF6506 family protein [Anaerovoracaceae bacterium]
MVKLAFIMNVPGESTEEYQGTYQCEKSTTLVVGTDGMEQTEALMKDLVADGYTLFDLCGDFDEEMRSSLADAIGADNQTKRVCRADYTAEQMEKLEALPSLSEYGIIINIFGGGENGRIDLLGKGCNSHILFVNGMEEAAQAAKQLVEEGIAFIELCSFFDGEKTKEIIDAIDGKVPVGTCGKLS